MGSFNAYPLHQVDILLSYSGGKAILKKVDVTIGITFPSEVDGQHYKGYIVTYPSIWVHALDRL